MIDICFIGIGVSAPEKIEEGTVVQSELKTKLCPEVIIGEGKVAHLTPLQKYGTVSYRIGIEFIEINKLKIREILNQIQSELCAEKRKNSK
ncbi:MAG: hypothetical protein NC908_04560 [Candidatus Omnitrophica bacterium]|nr:hypothetical protein [Candidatus Omnitrophota bacterium]